MNIAIKAIDKLNIGDDSNSRYIDTTKTYKIAIY